MWIKQDAGQMTNPNDLRWINPLPRVRGMAQCVAICVALATLTYAGFSLGFNTTAISFLYLLLVIVVALRWGFWQASLTSLLAVACLDYFFMPPLFHFDVDNPQNWVALAEFEVTALVISRLSARELRSAKEAAVNRTGMEQLYELSRNSLLMDMRQSPGPQLVVLIQRIFGARAVALFDVNLGRQDRAGEWNEGEENVARDYYLDQAAKDDASTHTLRRVLLAGPGPVGTLVVRGKLSSVVVDALASLAAIAIDRHQSLEKEERAENASKSEQLRAAVMDALAHEFKTPLTAVQTASSGLLELGGLTGSQRDLVALIDGEVFRMNKLCTRLLLTAKLEKGKVGLQTADVNVQELIAEVLAGKHAHEIRGRVEVVLDDPAITVRVDRALLVMALEQYMDNARKYSEPDTPIEIAARRSRAEVLISVHNFGSTIRIEDRERIFDRFYRSSDQKDAATGTGIGLSVVRKAAEAHHGHVWVISDEKEGTTFFLSLPTSARREL
jgi:two-component system sensor histidine kinase KdpD